jgi:hypothetical protein
MTAGSGYAVGDGKRGRLLRKRYGSVCALPNTTHQPVVTLLPHAAGHPILSEID